MAAKPGNSMNLNSTTPGLVNWDGTATMSTTGLVQYYVMSGAGNNTVNNISPLTAGYVLTSNGLSSQPTFQPPTYNILPWTDKATTFLAAVENGYFVTATATATLPASPTQGQVVAFAVDVAPGTGLLTIATNTGQFIRVGNAVTGSAGSGTVVNNFQGDSIFLVYRSADTTWIAAPGTMGSWTVT